MFWIIWLLTGYKHCQSTNYRWPRYMIITPQKSFLQWFLFILYVNCRQIIDTHYYYHYHTVLDVSTTDKVKVKVSKSTDSDIKIFSLMKKQIQKRSSKVTNRAKHCRQMYKQIRLDQKQLLYFFWSQGHSNATRYKHEQIYLLRWPFSSTLGISDTRDFGTKGNMEAIWSTIGWFSVHTWIQIWNSRKKNLKHMTCPMNFPSVES